MRPAKDYIVFPLDVPSMAAAKEYVALLSDVVGMFKVGLELFVRSGPQIIEWIKCSGDTQVFLDLKLHDIPETVKRAMRSISDLGVTFATVHCGETKQMLEAAVAGSGGDVGVLGVTVLTSVSGTDLHTAGFREEFHSDASKLVMKRAAMAKGSGCMGVVCSGLEVRMIKDAFGKDFIGVTPGIRPAIDGVPDDQQRVTTPAQAILNGADYLVIGRPIREAKDPRSAAIQITTEIKQALKRI
ncbi:hypothetical protein LCGC14_2175670 [marine sediment metagenome]|uniref:Orotidine 5'-phosphate decarboxylase n=1 Tax=marine sediment metagenome TaxID=412755 RepID=A0A0F9DNU6_9ZZZZ